MQFSTYFHSRLVNVGRKVDRSKGRSILYGKLVLIVSQLLLTAEKSQNNGFERLTKELTEVHAIRELLRQIFQTAQDLSLLLARTAQISSPPKFVFQQPVRVRYFFRKTFWDCLSNRAIAIKIRSVEEIARHTLDCVRELSY